MKLTNYILIAVCFVNMTVVKAQEKKDSVKAIEKKSHWYDALSLRGYTQIRYNRFLETNKKLKCEQCDKSWGEGGGVFIRRGRIVLSGNVHERVFTYIQFDLASAPSSTNLHYGQLRDAYFDLALDNKKEFRFRIGQSKVPYGFENLQSSQNRLPLDRADGLNSAVANERDLGIFFYWASSKIRERFNYLVSSGLKGSGDYGVFGLGVYNGQTANKPELNEEPHLVSRLTYPFKINEQYIEAGVQGYSGMFVLPSDARTPKVKTRDSFTDKRAAASIVVYPQPFGFQAEYNVGVGPEFNPSTDSIETQELNGGYAMLMYRQQFKKHTLIPFARYHFYNGGKKHELDARHYKVSEYEFGIEWSPFKQFELVAMYTVSDRTFEDFKLQDNKQMGNLLRLQVQFNY